MNEDTGGRVTRLRRRLSVEQSEDPQSPAPSTPSKKRGARLAAKPALGNINENEDPVVPQVAKKNTPARRNSRLVSNTETSPSANPITPARLIGRLTSGDNAQAYVSPRAIRAARRNSAIESDTETVSTPRKPMRRTRKDSVLEAVEDLEEPQVAKEKTPARRNSRLASNTDTSPITPTGRNNRQSSSPQSGNDKVTPTKGSPQLANLVVKISPLQEQLIGQAVSPRAIRAARRQSLIDAVENLEKHQPPKNKTLTQRSSLLALKTDTPAITPTERHNVSPQSGNDKVTPTKGSPRLTNLEVKIAPLQVKLTPLQLIGQAISPRAIRAARRQLLIDEIVVKDAIVKEHENSPPRSPHIIITGSTCNETTPTKSPLPKPSSSHSIDIENGDDPSKTSNIENTDINSPRSSPRLLKLEKGSCATSKHTEDKLAENIFSQNQVNEKENESVLSNLSTTSFKDTILHRTRKKCNSMNKTTSEIISKVNEKANQRNRTRSLNDFEKSKNHNLNKLFFESLKMRKNNTSLDKQLKATKDVLKSKEPESNNNIHTEKYIEPIASSQDSLINNNLNPDVEKDNDLLENDRSTHNQSQYRSLINQSKELENNRESLETITKPDSDTSILSINNEQFGTIDQQTNPVSASKLQNDSCEPMDVDETLPINRTLVNDYKNDSLTEQKENIPCPDMTKESNSSQKKRKSSSNDVSVSNHTQEKQNLSVTTTHSQKISELVIIMSKNNILLDTSISKHRKSLSVSEIKENSSDANIDTILSQSKDLLSFNVSMNNPQLILCPLEISHDITSKKSTPLKHKHIQKLGVQTSTPNLEKDNTLISNKSEDVDNTQDESYDSESSKSVSNSPIDDQAEDAGDDYQSGDSQDEDEKEYLRANEIVEKGDTLTSEEDISDDSDYEKDSFVVSSNYEDDELLSGSGDDLNMSENELTMSAKSKNKYNKRKEKERSRASQEMYDARHGRDFEKRTDDKDIQSKHSSRQRIESTADSSEDEDVINPKKRNRQQISSTREPRHVESEVKSKRLHRQIIDSSEDEGVTVYETTNKSKNKNRMTLDSDSETSDIMKTNTSYLKDESNTFNKDDEKEITIMDDVTTDKDPLNSSKIIKIEPKTPQKDISAIKFTGRDEIEEMDVDENISLQIPVTETDPLQYEESSSSGNEEIIQNFDNVLNNLNNIQCEKKQSVNISLNLERKSKAKKNKIIDELNLTQTNKELIKIKNKQDRKNINNDQLSQLQNINPEENTKEDNYMTGDYIPLKLSDSKDAFKTELSDSRDEELLHNNSVMDKSMTKSKKKKKSECAEELIHDEDNIVPDNSLINESVSKSKKKNKTQYTEEESVTENIMQDESLINKSLTKSKKKKNSLCLEEIAPEMDNIMQDNSLINKSLTKSKKKKNSLCLEEIAPEMDNIMQDNSLINKSLTKSKKKKNSLCLEEIAPEMDNIMQDNSLINKSLTKSKKKKNSLCLEEIAPEMDNIMQDNSLTNKSLTKSKKKKNSLCLEEIAPEMDNIMQDNSLINKSLTKSKKKKNSLCLEEIAPEMDNIMQDNSLTNKSLTKSKKKKNSLCLEEIAPEMDNIMQDDSLINKSKSKKKKKSRCLEKIAPEMDNIMQDESLINTSLTKSKKKKKSICLEEIAPEIDNIMQDNPLTNESSAKSRKKKKSELTEEIAPVIDNIMQDPETNTSNDSVSRKKNKKRKRKAIEEDQPVQDLWIAGDQDFIDNEPGSNKADDDASKNKKRKRKHGTNIVEEIQISTMPNKAKKRKMNDDERKTSNHEMLDIGEVRRLGSNLVDQLADQPVVSTTGFQIELLKHNKLNFNKLPSRYLEESVYLNDPPRAAKRVKIPLPKQLPTVYTVKASTSGFTTNFELSVLNKKDSIVQPVSNMYNFKENIISNRPRTNNKNRVLPRKMNKY